MRSKVVRALTIVAIGAPVAGAQQPAATAPRAGETVELRARGRDAGGRRIECDATVSTLAGDTVVLQNIGRWYPCPSRAYAPDEIARLRVMRGHRGSRLVHAALGLGIGGVAGGVAGRALAGDGCQSGGCDDGDLAVAIITFLGAITGGATGLIIGAALPAGPQWVTLPANTSVRVAGLNVQPGIQMRVGGR